MTIPEGSTFELVKHIDTRFDIPVTTYRSKVTGMEVVVLGVDSPITSGYFCIPTEEAHELLDKGLPHTLEHLIFLGSEDFPYKGVLDTLANRARARGTNAWTATDHTCYTVSCAGSAGFLKIMPIYIDHVLYPTLTDSGYVTEVHHVNGKGEDGGVVYSEMQGRERTSFSLTYHRMAKLMYPAPSGYSSETGGLMRKLRDLDIDQIRKYHKHYYRPDNLCLIISGKVDHEQLLSQLSETEKKIASKGALPAIPRPWVDSDKTELVATYSEVVPFPDEDESKGNVFFGFRGPSITETRELDVFDTLLMYLTDSSASLLQRTFVECAEPLATSIDYYSIDSLDTFALVYVSSVDTAKLGTVESQVMRVLGEHSIDMARMHSVIELRSLRRLNRVERSPADTLTSNVISHFMYGKRDATDLAAFVENTPMADLMAVSAAEWQAALERYLVNARRVTLLAKPSAQLAKEIAEDEAARKADRQRDPAQLTRNQEVIATATQANDMPVPSEIISGFAVPELDAELPGVTTAQLAPLQGTGKSTSAPLDNALQREADAQDPMPFFVQLDQVKSQFVGSRVVVDTSAVPVALRPYLCVYSEALFASPVKLADGTVLSHEEVSAGLSRDTVNFASGIGALGGGNAFAAGAYESQLSLSVNATVEKYAAAAEWVLRNVRHLVVDYGRLATIVRNLLSDVPEVKRDASGMIQATARGLMYDAAACNASALTVAAQEPFLKQLLARIDAKDPQVAADIEALQAALYRPEHVRLHVSGAVSKVGVAAALAPWRALIATTGSAAAATVPVYPLSHYANALGTNPSSLNGNAKLLNIASNESGYLNVIARGVAGLEHADLAPLMVTLDCFSTLEGPFWKKIRGEGHAYGAGMSANALAGTVGLSVYRGANVVMAYTRAREIVNEAIAGTLVFDKEAVDGSKASVAFAVIAREEGPLPAAAASFQFHALASTVKSARYNQWLVNQIDAVTTDDIVRVTKQYLPALFDPATALFVCAAGPTNLDSAVTGFKDLGVDFTVVNVSDE
ncbi:Metalloenzyme, LuxS/M16 peptidase-like protein [Blastocladiella britannica]|nr:Metalloenzyme, LuxS/M16 peptidase-like protein [Blastocladiella britannica]